MSVVVEARPGGTWRIRIKQKQADGRWRVVKEVPGFTSEKDARAEAAKAKKLMRQGKLGTLEATPTTGSLIDDHEAKLTKRGAPSAYHVKLARAHLAPILEIESGKLTHERLQDLVDDLDGARVGPWAIRRAISILKTSLKRVRRADNPAKGLTLPRPPKSKPRVMTIDEARAVLPHMHETERDFYAVGVHTGLRPGELAAVQIPDVDVHLPGIFVRRSLTREMPKDGDARFVPLSPEALLIVKRLIKTSEDGVHLFGEVVRRHARDSNLTQRLYPAIRRAVDAGDAPTLSRGWSLKCRWCKHVEHRQKKPPGDVKCPECDRLLWLVPEIVKVRWYDLRHTHVTLLLEAGVDVNLVSNLAGHSSPAFTMENYVHLAQKKLVAAVENISLKKKGGRR